MAPTCPITQPGGAGFRGSPVPLVLAPIIFQLVRYSRDPKIVAYVRNQLATGGGGGPAAIVQNAHRIVQYALSKVPSNILYWFVSKVLNLPPEVAMQTTEFLKSRTELEVLLLEPEQAVESDGTRPDTMMMMQSIPSLDLDIERRLERLENDYLLLQEKNNQTIKSLTFYQSNTLDIPTLESPPLLSQCQQYHHHQQQHQPTIADMHDNESCLELVNLDSPPPLTVPRTPSDNNQGLESQVWLQDVGLRLGRILLEWAGETLKQTLVTATAAKSSTNPHLVGAGIDLASRLVDAIIIT